LVAGLLLSYDIKNIVINGYFGPDGEALIQTLAEALSQAPIIPYWRRGDNAGK
jgi:hypothetical protein